jgi:D-alanine-D-alanine ligase
VKVVIVYNRDSKNVINLFGQPNRELVGMGQIRRITDALRAGGHQTMALEADKDLIRRLEEFMPRVVKGERPGMVFNVSYGIQGQARYTHVPSILEMMGMPYVASGPLAHSLALDKVVTKVILVQHGLSTPEFAVLETPDTPLPDLPFPLIVKPKHEAVSFGIRVVRSQEELKGAAATIFDMFGQAVLVERYIDGREVNVGLLGNGPPDALPPVELAFGDTGDKVYSYEDKSGKSGREIRLLCPAPIGEELTEKAKSLAKRAFSVLGCSDCARVDMRLDDQGRLYILEVNSLPSLGAHGSYVYAAAEAGLDFPALVNRLVEVASARYFGTPSPPHIPAEAGDPEVSVFSYLTERRDQLERRLRDWCRTPSRTEDPIGLEGAAREMERVFRNVAMKPVAELTDERSITTWETNAGIEDGTLLVAHLDVPLGRETLLQSYRREPEWLYGEGVASSRAALVMIEFSLRALRQLRVLRKRRLGVVLYMDEGRDCRYSSKIMRNAMAKARHVLVLRPGGVGGAIYQQRRGQRRYRFIAEGTPSRSGKATKRTEVLVWFAEKLQAIARLSLRKERVSVSFMDLRTEGFPMLAPHRLEASVLLSYADSNKANQTEEAIRLLLGRGGPRWEFEIISDRPPLQDRTVWPSVAGLAPPSAGVLCGLGPVARDLQTPTEAIQRLSLVQRTLLLGEFLLNQP